MALAKNAVIFLMTMISLLGVSMAAVYSVGDAAGWTIMGAAEYQNWADHKDFHVGDTLVFKYDNQFHNVEQVSLKDFLSCDAPSPIATYVTGSDSVTLKSAGHYYFLCGIPGHCDAGQKVEIVVTPTSLRSAASPVLAPSPTVSETSTITYSSTHENTAPSLSSYNFLFVSMLVLALCLDGFANF